MRERRWGIQRRVTVFLFLAVVLSSLIVAFAVARLANSELEATVRQQIAVLHDHLRQRFRAFDLLLDEQEKTLDARLKTTLPETAAALAAQSASPESAPPQLLDKLCRRYGYDYLYIINHAGVVVDTNFAADRGLDLGSLSPRMNNMLDGLYGKGRVLSDRFNVSVKTGRLHKYAYYSPAGSDYIVEASLDLRRYIERNADPRLERFIFDELLDVPRTPGSRVNDLDVFIVNGAGSWSLAHDGNTLPDDVRRAFMRRDVDQLSRRQGNQLVVYERYARMGSSNGETDSLVTKVAYDTGPEQALLSHTLWLAAGMAVFFGLLAFFLAFIFFHRWLVHPVKSIAAGLQDVGQGRFQTQSATGVPELDVITRGINAMQAEMVQRERALVDANNNLETRVRERTSELQTLNEELTQQASTDSLTGVATRRVFFDLGTVELARMHRLSITVIVVVLDIDYFKSINDSLGHAAGDRVLQLVGEIMRSELRRTDVVARLGGEEFGIILSGSDRGAAREVLERIRLHIAAAAVQTEGGPTAVTVSMGMTECTRDDDIVSALRRADLALYEAKNTGRNRIAAV